MLVGIWYQQTVVIRRSTLSLLCLLQILRRKQMESVRVSGTPVGLWTSTFPFHFWLRKRNSLDFDLELLATLPLFSFLQAGRGTVNRISGFRIPKPLSVTAERPRHVWTLGYAQNQARGVLYQTWGAAREQPDPINKRSCFAYPACVFSLTKKYHTLRCRPTFQPRTARTVAA